MDCSHPDKLLKICSGPGCQAWDSEKILNLVRESMDHPNYSKGTHIVPVTCMNKCGGGVSVEILPIGKSLKLRDPNEVLKVLNLD